ncbi:MAG: hypothetical protein M1828_002146 [Chrysothrix sp. TS-e1954]|nr:MAG: hypothetical protein M1828_002146 [Chrysothrix sp. TS-e1954]
MSEQRLFKVTTQISDENIGIRVGEPSLKRKELGLSTWGSSTVLANHLHRVPMQFKSATNHDGAEETASPSIDVLELGAGTGLVGIAAAAVWQANVMLTDVKGVVPNLAANVALNAKLLARSGAHGYAGTLDWGSPDVLIPHGSTRSMDPQSLVSKPKVILAADTIYSEEIPAAFVNVVNLWLDRSSTSRLIMAYPMRVACLDHIRELWQRLEDAGLHAIDEGREEVGVEWDDERLHEWSVWKWHDVTDT